MKQSFQNASKQSTVDQLAFEVLHEIRNPLDALGNLTYLAHEEAHNPEKVRMYMRLAAEQMATLNRIASQTLGYARTTSLLTNNKTSPANQEPYVGMTTNEKACFQAH